MKIVRYDSRKHSLLLQNMFISYEAEFSYITKKKPDDIGCFNLDLDINDDKYNYFFVYIENQVVGFSVVKNERVYCEMCEFYIYPCFRRKKYGKVFASKIFDMYKKKWIVKQLPLAKNAYHFWLDTISSYTNDSFSDTIMSDDYWGDVSCQEFYVQ